MLNPLDMIERKKHGQNLAADEIAAMVEGFTRDEIPSYQMSAFLMAVWFRGMTVEETVAMTAAMLHSGSQLDWGDLQGLTADKHSTGGVGDKVSLLLAPLAAACGLKVPMLSGRGLGHTGGTLDKLEAIPGYRIFMPNREFRDIVSRIGCAIVGQNEDIAPADGKIYALRDVTATIDSVPLITASILSKKLAAGPETVVIDLKTGSGAFMPDLRQARILAASLVGTMARWPRRLSVLFTDMSQPLGHAVGHAMETIEAFQALRPEGRRQGPPDLVRLTEELVAEMLLLSARAADRDEAVAQVREVWDSGEAFAAMGRWVAAQGGRLACERRDFGLTVAPPTTEVAAERDGHVARIDCRQIGLAMGDLGGARQRVEETLDLTVGIEVAVKIGDPVGRGQTLAIIHGRDANRDGQAQRRIARAITLSEEPASAPDLILERSGP
jgi:pyrimidine-nucleoside phosphorylase